MVAGLGPLSFHQRIAVRLARRAPDGRVRFDRQHRVFDSRREMGPQHRQREPVLVPVPADRRPAQHLQLDIRPRVFSRRARVFFLSGGSVGRRHGSYSRSVGHRRSAESVILPSLRNPHLTLRQTQGGLSPVKLTGEGPGNFRPLRAANASSPAAAPAIDVSRNAIPTASPAAAGSPSAAKISSLPPSWTPIEPGTTKITKPS